MQNGSRLRQVATILFILAYRAGRFVALVFPRSLVEVAQVVLNAMGAMLPPMPPSISFLGVSGSIFGKFLVNFWVL